MLERQLRMNHAPPSHARVVVVVGAGSSIAYHLTKLGVSDVIVLERGTLKAVGRRKGTSLRMSRTQSRNRHVTEAARPRIGAAWAAQAPMADHVRTFDRSPVR
jgi:glycine/D-amino acid oxidase-like deaminating enzyme